MNYSNRNFVIMGRFCCVTVKYKSSQVKILLIYRCFHKKKKKKKWIILIQNLYHIYQPLSSDRIWHKVNFLAEFNRFEFRVFLLLDELPHEGWRNSLPYYSPIAGGKIIGFIPFRRVLVLCEMQQVSSGIRTQKV